MSIEWLAGLLEGEGCFGFYKTGRYRHLTVALQMNDRDVVERAAQWPGATPVRKNERPATNHQDGWNVTWTGLRARDLMLEILPHMGERRTDKILSNLADFYEEQMKICSECGTEFSLIRFAETRGRRLTCSEGCREVARAKNQKTYQATYRAKRRALRCP